MTRALFRLLVVLVAVPAFDGSAAAQGLMGMRGSSQQGMPARDQQGVRQAGMGRIRGRILAADSGQPLRRVVVRASAPELHETVSATTGPDGLYELKGLPAGRYTVTASRSPFVTLSFGQGRGTEAGQPIEVAANQAVDRVDIRLSRGGIITGTIVDEFGEPVADTQVVAMRQQYVAGRRRLLPVGRTATTNDVGAYRLFGLTPGSYYLAVTSDSMEVALNDLGTEGEAGDVEYAATYYPGTADLAQAQRLTVSAGQTLTGVTVSLVPTHTASVSGIIVDRFGNRANAGGIVASQRGTASARSLASMVNPDGSFTLRGLTPGDYVLTASVHDGVGGEAMAVTTVSVNGQDVTGLELRPEGPATVQGRVILDGGAAQSFGRHPVQLALLPMDAEEAAMAMSVPPVVALSNDLTFDTTAPTGRVTVRLAGSDGHWNIKSVHYQGLDVTDSGFDIRGGENLSGLDIELTSRSQELSGVVTAGAGKPSARYTAVVFPRDRELWQGMSRHIAVGRPDQHGRFRITTLPPAEYLAVAVETVEEGAWMDPDFLDSVWHAATSLTIREGETAAITLPLVATR